MRMKIQKSIDFVNRMMAVFSPAIMLTVNLGIVASFGLAALVLTMADSSRSYYCIYQLHDPNSFFTNDDINGI